MRNLHQCLTNYTEANEEKNKSNNRIKIKMHTISYHTEIFYLMSIVRLNSGKNASN